MTRTVVFRMTSLIAIAAAAGACGPGRTAAATQSTPKAFDPAASDPKAIAIVDEAIAAHGGEAAWANAKEIHWTQVVAIDGAAKEYVRHVWDRWNGRHRFARDLESGGGYWIGYDVYERIGAGQGYNADGAGGDLATAERKEVMEEATKRLWVDSYRLLVPFKLKDPGVRLKYLEERGDPPATPDAPPPPPKWHVIEVTFDADVGPEPTNKYSVYINKETRLVEIIERPGREGNSLIGYRLEDWIDIAGLKLPQRWTNLGFTGPDTKTQPLTVPKAWEEQIVPPSSPVPNPGETILLLKIKITSDPDDRYYIPEVKGGSGPGEHG